MTGIRSITPVSANVANATVQDSSKAEFKQKFDEVLGETMYGMMFKAMRKSSHKSAYFNGGQTEQLFGQQLDQLLAEKMAHRDASKFSNLSTLANLPRK
jgi:Rod binding domain-containing protein